MCGIFGIFASRVAGHKASLLGDLTNSLLLLSESRGKEAAGVAVRSSQGISVYKQPMAASSMIRSRQYAAFITSTLEEGLSAGPVAIIGHSRLVTNGVQAIPANNQPVVRDGFVAVHNGIITNVDDLWREFAHLDRQCEVDTEVALALMRHAMPTENDWPRALSDVFSRIEGTASLGVFRDDADDAMFATNNGSMYLAAGGQGLTVFASERYILNKVVADPRFTAVFGTAAVRHVPAGRSVFMDLETLRETWTEIDRPAAPSSVAPPPAGRVPIRVNTEREEATRSAIRRCTRCILPETMPFISFDEQGVCNYCRNFRPMQVSGREQIERLVAPHRRSDGEADCLVMFSGGRDSSYGLHLIKKELGLNPIAYTYDWGMITDLGRRNQARLCGSLGVEHIIVSADIEWKRKNIQKNINAWLKRPHLGMIPLFMAGDKQYYYFAERIRRDNNLNLLFVCECPLELSRFKAGFCGVNESQSRIFNISFGKKLSLISYYASQYIKNPAYINMSIFDNIFAFWSSYFMPHNFHFLFRHFHWDEDTINRTLLDEYDWETDPETPTTWRIGDGTAAFYNYIYFTVAGFTENDTLRSNQIREGVLTRDQALERIHRENHPRWTAMEWYAHTIGFNLNEAIRVINSMPKLYAADL